jgi:hypothetical protein
VISDLKLTPLLHLLLGVASAAKAAAQAASEALAQAEAVSLATENAHKNALADARARASRTEQTLATLENLVGDANAQKEKQNKTLGEKIAAAAAGGNVFV